MKHNVSSNRCRLAFGLAKLEYHLILRLVKNVNKYVNHFGEYPEIYRRTLNEYLKWANNVQPRIKTLIKTLKPYLLEKSITGTALKENIVIGPRFREMIDKYLYSWPDRRKNLLARYIFKYGFSHARLFPLCGSCGGDNSRTDVTDICPFFRDGRDATLEKIRKLKRAAIMIQIRIGLCESTSHLIRAGTRNK